MRAFEKTLLLVQHLLIFMFLTFSANSEDSFKCDEIPIQEPLNRMLLCRSQKLYFRTSLGLFPISSVNYTAKHLTVSHSSCSLSSYYVSPSLLSAGFPKPKQPNSVLLFNCSNTAELAQNSPQLVTNYPCNSQTCEVMKTSTRTRLSNCYFVDNIEKLDDMGFRPRDLNCSHYRRVYKENSSGGNDGRYDVVELGTRVSFDIPDHVPNICNECEKPYNGNCGIALRCICHPKECKDKVISKSSEPENPFGNVILVSLISVLVLIMV